MHLKIFCRGRDKPDLSVKLYQIWVTRVAWRKEKKYSNIRNPLKEELLRRTESLSHKLQVCIVWETIRTVQVSLPMFSRETKRITKSSKFEVNSTGNSNLIRHSFLNVASHKKLIFQIKFLPVSDAPVEREGTSIAKGIREMTLIITLLKCLVP